MNTLKTLLEAYNWCDIPGCPGRAVLREFSAELDNQVATAGQRFAVATSRDPVTIWVFTDRSAALLSFEQPDGSYVHTLNTPAGFERKCLQLGIDPGVPVP